MSLQVWLPLDGDLHNQGLSNIIVTNDGATIDNNGKIGKCYSFNNTHIIIDSIQLQNLFKSVTQPFSMACWIYLNTDETDRVIIFGNYNANPFVNWELTADGTQRICVGGSSNYTTKASTLTVPKTTWTHIAFTYNGTTTKFYQNGVKTNELSGSNTLTTKTASSRFYLGSDTRTGATRLKGKLNDFRIYDHALSDKEIEEIAKGLILHYPLNNNGLGGENLALHTHDLDADDAKTNLNMGIRGSAVRRLHQSGFYESKCTASWQGLSVWANQLNLSVGTKVTYSFYIYGNGSTRGFSFYPMMYNSSGTRDTSTGMPISIDGKSYTTVNSKAFTSTTATSPEYHYATFEWNQAVANIINNGGSIALTIQVHGSWKSGDWACLFAPKIEIGEFPTPWSPAPSEINNNNIIYDISGHNHNGIAIGQLEIITPSPRYNCATHFSATNQKIKIDNLTTIGFGNSYSFAWWEKINSVDSMHWGFANGIRLNGMYKGKLWNTGDSSNNPLYIPGSTTQVTVPSINIWHHWVMTGNGTKCRVYQDGELWAEAKTYKGISGTTIYLNGWAENTEYSSNDASMSDFRIYATALTSEQIKELYNTSMIVENGIIKPRDLE